MTQETGLNREQKLNLTIFLGVSLGFTLIVMATLSPQFEKIKAFQLLLCLVTIVNAGLYIFQSLVFGRNFFSVAGAILWLGLMVLWVSRAL